MVSNEFAAIILLSKSGELILQLRDDKLTIADPGKLSLFAGRLEPGETPAEGAERELWEETTLRLDSLAFYKAYYKDPARHGAEGTCWIYVGRDIDPADLDVREGQGYRLVPGIDSLSEDGTALISYDILVDFAASEAATRKTIDTK